MCAWHHLHCLEKPLNIPFVHFSCNRKLPRNERKRHPYFRSKPHDSFQMTSHVSKRHHVAFGARNPGKFETVYYNLPFSLVFGHFWTSTSYFLTKTFLGKLTWLLTWCGCLAPFVLPRKVSEHPICSFLVKPKTFSKWT